MACEIIHLDLHDELLGIRCRNGFESLVETSVETFVETKDTPVVSIDDSTTTWQWLNDDGERHRDGLPAYIKFTNGPVSRLLEQRWYTNGNLHRINDPAVIVYHGKRTTKCWYYHGKLHRYNGNDAVIGASRQTWHHGQLQKFTVIHTLDNWANSNLDLNMNYIPIAKFNCDYWSNGRMRNATYLRLHLHDGCRYYMKYVTEWHYNGYIKFNSITPCITEYNAGLTSVVLTVDSSTRTYDSRGLFHSTDKPAYIRYRHEYCVYVSPAGEKYLIKVRKYIYNAYYLQRGIFHRTTYAANIRCIKPNSYSFKWFVDGENKRLSGPAILEGELVDGNVLEDCGVKVRHTWYSNGTATGTAAVLTTHKITCTPCVNDYLAWLYEFC